MKNYRRLTCAALSLATPLFSVDWSDQGTPTCYGQADFIEDGKGSPPQ